MSNIQRGIGIVRTIYFSPAEEDVSNKHDFQKPSPAGESLDFRSPQPRVGYWTLIIDYWTLKKTKSQLRSKKMLNLRF
jgi:hypothetical protein